MSERHAIPRDGYTMRDIAAGRIHVAGGRIVQGPAPGFALRPQPAPPPPRAASPAATSSPRTSPAPSAPRASSDQKRRDANGKIGEAVAEVLHDICRRAGVADVMKVPTAMQLCGRDPSDPRFFRATFARRVGVDYRGHLCDGSGRAVYSEIKHVQDDDAGFSLRDVRPEQRAQLDAAVAARAVAVLVIVRGPRRDVFALPWAVARAHRVLHTTELAPWKVRAGHPYLQHFCQRRVR
jgi:hypothetical protein